MQMCRVQVRAVLAGLKLCTRLCAKFSGFFFSCNEYLYFVHWSMAQGLLLGRLFKKEEESFNHKSTNLSQRSDSTLCFVCKWCILAFVKQNPGPIQDSTS